MAVSEKFTINGITSKYTKISITYQDSTLLSRADTYKYEISKDGSVIKEGAINAESYDTEYSHTISTLIPGTTYSIRLLGYDSDGTLKYETETTTFTTLSCGRVYWCITNGMFDERLLFVKVNDEWKPSSKIYVKVDDVWKENILK